MSNLKVFLTAFKVELASCMAYRFDFFISLILVFMGEFILPLVTLLIYSSGTSFPGWSLYEVLLIQGIFLLAKGLSNVLISGIIYNTLSRVREGTFDLLLIKPKNTLFMAVVTGFNLGTLGSLASGLVLFVFAASHVQVASAYQWLQFLVWLLVSLLVLFSFNIFSAAIVFKWVGNSRIYEMFDCVTSFGMYPRSIFSNSVGTLISYVIPITVIGFIPATVLLNKQVQGMALSGSVAIIFFGLSLLFWRKMLGNYTSAGG